MSLQSSIPGMTPQAPVSGTTVAPSIQVSGSPSPALGPPAPRGPNTSEPSNDSVRAKFVTTPGFVVPAPSFQYSVISQSGSTSGSSQQSPSAPAVKIIPPTSAAALQPPVPRQSSGSVPSFSYNLISQPNVGSASGQQLQTGTVTGPGNIQVGKFAPPNTAASLQPPVPGRPGRPNQFVPGTIPQNMPAPMQSPISVPKGHPSIAAGFSFGGSSQLPVAAESSQNKQSSNTSASAAVVQETGTVPAASSSSQSTALPVYLSSSSSMIVPASPSVYPMTMWTQTAPSLPGPPGMPRTPGTPGPPGIPSASISSTANARPAAMDPSASLRPMPLPAPVPSNSAAVAVHQQLYPPYHSQPAMAPPPQGHWLQPPQVSGLQRPPYMPYPTGLPAPFPLPVRGIPPSMPLPDSQPPGVSPVVPPVGTSPATAGSGQPTSSVGTQSPPPGIDQDKQSDGNTSMNGEIAKSEDADLWTAHKTETGAVYYYNSLTGQSTPTKSRFSQPQFPRKLFSQPFLGSVELDPKALQLE